MSEQKESLIQELIRLQRAANEEWKNATPEERKLIALRDLRVIVETWEDEAA